MTQNEKSSKAVRADKVKQLRQEAARKDRRTRGLVTAAVLIVVVGLLAALAVGIKAQSGKASATPANTTSSLGHVVKAPGADPKVELDIYEDFQCPHCKTLEDAIGPVLDKHIDAGDIAVNYHMMSFLGPESTRAAAAAACLADEGMFRAFHTEMFANQAPENSGIVTTSYLKGVATRVGATSKPVQECISANTYRKLPERVNAKASKAGVSSTPALFLNGEKVEFDGDLAAFDAKLTEAAEKAVTDTATKPAPAVTSTDAPAS